VWYCSNHSFLLSLFENPALELEFLSDLGCWQNLLIWCSFVDAMIEHVMLIISGLDLIWKALSQKLPLNYCLGCLGLDLVPALNLAV
jgi:hypothetical protein